MNQLTQFLDNPEPITKKSSKNRQEGRRVFAILREMPTFELLWAN